MKSATKTLYENLPALTTSLRKQGGLRESWDDEPPLRAELFSTKQMEQHGKVLAQSHQLSTTGQGQTLLLKRLADNERTLSQSCKLLVEAIKQGRQITPASEWLLDNFYLIEEQIRTAKRHLPKDYSRELPRLQKGPSAGLPRVYDIALETIAHSDARLDPEGLSRFVAAYQSVTPLKLGELWAIPIMLRLALIENLRRVAVRVAISRMNRDLADSWSDQMTETADQDPSSLILVIADMARSEPPMEGSFVAELARRLQGQGPALALPLTWIEQRLAQSGTTSERLIQGEIQQQAADQVSISNSIGSLRFLGSMNWRDFVETLSVVEQMLRTDPSGAYSLMDFATRDHYRHSVEKIARYSAWAEPDVARKAIELCAAATASQGRSDRSAHVGFFLIDDGLPQLEQATGMRAPRAEAWRTPVRRAPLSSYLLAITLLTLAVCVGLSFKAYGNGIHGWLLAATGLLSLIAGSQLAVALVNWLATILATPKPLPRMDFSTGIPAQARTLVAVPTILTASQDIEDLCEVLEVRFLANRCQHLHFCLLTDFADAEAASTHQDAALLHQVRQHIEELNQKYPNPEADIFFLFHRPRRWNPQERLWMGYERKRGKLAELNAYLHGGARECFSLIVGATEVLSQVRYVITLDTDTQLPRDAAWQLVAAMAHPLNRPHYDADKQRITQGYGILQPRIAVSLPGTDASLYAQLCGGEPGIDPYTRAVSDVYQDLFREGSFIGKGIYEIDSFERVLAQLPENRILSHDLLEGCHARAGLLSDVQLYEKYPNSYRTDIRRRHRWVRGDWQLAGWLLPRAPAAGGQRRKNPLSTLSRWKIFDNLRRSVAPIALLLLLLVGWSELAAPWFWSWVVLGILLIPPLCTSLHNLLQKPDDVLWRPHLVTSMYHAGRQFGQATYTLICLPYEAFSNLDAILRVHWRMLISHRRLLEWNPYCETTHRSIGILGSYREMWFAPALALGGGLWLAVFRPAGMDAASLLLLLWLLAPAVAWYLSLPQAREEVELNLNQRMFLRILARRIWAFFETHVGPEDNWLPPDNVQEQPIAVTAHRTSPTNIGLALLANLTAYDFGYIPAGQLIVRTENTLSTMQSLERHQGHFYNWYSTHTLKPLHPMYVSTVDSGNLAGHLLTLRPGLLALAEQPILDQRVFTGLLDTLRLVTETAGRPALAQLAPIAAELGAAERAGGPTLQAAAALLQRTMSAINRFCENLNPDRDTDELNWWAAALQLQCGAVQDELEYLAPWTGPDTAAGWRQRHPELDHIPSLRELAHLDTAAATPIRQPAAGAEPQNTPEPLITLACQRARNRIATIERLAQQAADMAWMEYEFLYDRGNHLLAIGYNVSERRRDASYYDLLASEARLASFIAIAQGQLPQDGWFALGRQLTTVGRAPMLLSWSGSMFEYLMPLLIMPTYDKTLLDQTYKSAVTRQIEYGQQRGVPWGISESGYNAFDASLNYQYRAFGVPGLGLKRGLADDLVIAPYASALALMVAPEQACANLQRLAAEGFLSRFGFYEAIDYTAARLPRGKPHALIQSWMAHHQGMSLLSLAYLLLEHPMQRRFESDPLFQATALLLHEKIPKTAAFYSNTDELAIIRTATSSHMEVPVRVLATPNTPIPEVQLLSNGRYHVIVTNAGGGSSRWKELAVTRWHADSTCDNWGTFCYVRDVASGAFWSTAYQPTKKVSKNYEVIFSEGRAEFRRHDHDFDLHTEIVVSPEDDIELRRSRLVNRARTRRTIEITSYSEVVLAPAAADASHPAFSNLFVQTEILPRQRAILCTRRPRSQPEEPPWMLHLMAVHGVDIDDISYETDRLQFIGRNNSTQAPQAMLASTSLSGHQGSVLDPIVAIRYRITLDPEQEATIDMVTGVADSRSQCLALIGKYQDRYLADRVFELAWTHSQVVLRQLNATEADAQLYGRLASCIIYPNASLRADARTLVRNRRGQSGLWSYAISGDFPIVLCQIRETANIEIVRQLVQAHAYWRLKGLAVDLVIWNEDHAGYRQLLQEQIMGLIAAGIEAHVVDRPGGIFVRPGDQISNEDRILLQTVARAIISDDNGTLAEQVNRHVLPEVRIPRLAPQPSQRNLPVPIAEPAPLDLILANGLGGFSRDGREYVIVTTADQGTPAPWTNVIANPNFGTVISESGSAYTWGENAHEFRLTPWHNDPVSDGSGEAYYLRDEESGHFWSPTPLPSPGSTPYVTRHGFGYSTFEHDEGGISSELCVYVALDAAIKFSVLKIRNDSGRARQLSATGYVEWVLGDLRAKSNPYVITEVDATTGALFAHNDYNTEFAGRTAYFDVDDRTRSFSGDRTEFIGRNGSLRHPAALERVRLSGKVGAGLDPCAAIQVPFELADGQQREIVFKLGIAGRRSADASSLIRRFRGSAAAHATLEAVHQYWRQTLGAVQIDTPEPALNVLANGWLIYQTLACRLWARSGYYQSGGAFGFRDQLQDAMALVHTRPELLRAQLLLCAAHQFGAGDVQHWWHPPSNRGVRTKCSDDYLWLPLATCRYVFASGDHGVLDEGAHFLEGRPVNPDEDSYYDLPGHSHARASLYQHCTRAIEHGLRFGSHGLPLIGSCDWNDGMDKVGEHGKGESVWLAFFLYQVLQQFGRIARLRGDASFAERCAGEAAKLRQNLRSHAWDGAWYRRAYFDDGTPLGSAANAECQIDSISQSWSVLSGGGDPERSRQGMNAVDQRLVRRESALVQLLDPPFDHSDLNPGYIRGYAPGVRENGGQYTHAAIWAAMAFAELGDHARTWELLQMINPINHGDSAAKIAVYKVEPYVVAADVYAVAPHIGRGGWTWYTGSSGWMYRLILESLLGVRLEVDRLTFTPCLPPHWNSFALNYRYRETPYRITVIQGGDSAIRIDVDGVVQGGDSLLLVDDRQPHAVEVRVPLAPTPNGGFTLSEPTTT